MDRIAEHPQRQTGPDEASPETSGNSDAYPREWNGNHRINLRATLPLPSGSWYVTLVAGPERRQKGRRQEERKKHPLETVPNLLLLLSVGMLSAALLLTIAALILIHGFGWSIELTIPSS
ncbi:MAG: hypothetical protein AAFO01_09990 [Pseudomonadota bacterium]